MDLNFGGLVRQTIAPVQDAVSLVRTGGVDQIVSFLRDNPGQRGAIETALATGARAGDLSAIVERAGVATGQAVDVVRNAVDTATQPDQPIVGDSVSRAVRTALEVVGRTINTVGEASARTTQIVGDTVARAGSGAADALARPAQAGETLARFAVDSSRLPLPVEARSVGSLPRAPALAEGFATRAGDTLAAAIRDGRVAELITVAAKEGRLAELVTDARATGRLPTLVSAARTLDGVLVAFAAKGGLSATELALFARAALLSAADIQALRDAGVPVDIQFYDPATLQPPPRDGPAEERFDADGVPIAGAPAGGGADPVLARFDSGAIRITSRSAVETYGALGPPGGMIVAADAFEALLRAADCDLAAVERQLGLDVGVLSDPDTLVAFVERRDLAGLRLPPDGFGAAAASWLPGGDKAGGLLAALADLGRGTPFREMTLAGTGR